MQLYKREVKIILWAPTDGYYDDPFPQTKWLPEEEGEAALSKCKSENPNGNFTVQERYIPV